MATTAPHCAFVLLAEFDIDRGAQLTYQFPQPLGTDESLLANLMLPDGAEKQLEDWTIFFLNQTPFNTIAPALAPDYSEDAAPRGIEHEDGPELLYVLNLVRTKYDKTARRGAVVKAMAICTRHPFIQIFKPILLLALDDYFNEPSQECLAGLFDAVNAMDISMAPMLTRNEKLIMRASERKDVFAEKFLEYRPASSNSNIRTAAAEPPTDPASSSGGGLVGSGVGVPRTRTDSLSSQVSEPESSFSLGGNPVWVGDDTVAEVNPTPSTNGHYPGNGQTTGRQSDELGSESSHGIQRSRNDSSTLIATYSETQHRPTVKDTHFFQTAIRYKDYSLPIRVPLSTFPEEVGDYSLIQLVQTFSQPGLAVTGPQHPHLHSNGSLTHPIIVLFNALVTGKRIIFLGYHRPAGEVSSYVLAACALGSGCGAVLRGFIARAFPYATLNNRDEWINVPGYIAGVTNPIFESAGQWDLLCDIAPARMVVNKDINQAWPSSQSAPPVPILPRANTLKSEGSFGHEDDLGRVNSQGREKDLASRAADLTAKADNQDNAFIEDIIAAISYHFGESLVRARFMDYVIRFVRLAARYEEELTGSTKIGYPSAPFTSGLSGYAQLGSGLVFTDDVSGNKEINASASRIDAWRRTKMYETYSLDFQISVTSNACQGFDLWHQLWRLRNAKSISDAEADMMYRTIAENVQNYDQVVELLALLPPYHGGLLPLTFGLFHQLESVRECSIDVLSAVRAYPVGVQFLQSLNHFHRYAYVRQAHARETKQVREPNSLYPPPSSFVSRTPSNRSESSLGTAA